LTIFGQKSRVSRDRETSTPLPRNIWKKPCFLAFPKTATPKGMSFGGSGATRRFAWQSDGKTRQTPQNGGFQKPPQEWPKIGPKWFTILGHFWRKSRKSQIFAIFGGV